MKKSIIKWTIKKMRRRIPALLLLTLAQAVNALFGVLFALGSRAVIDSAVAGTGDEFIRACLNQGGIIAVILLSLALTRHLRDQFSAELERDWKRSLLHGLLHGDYAAVSTYHSGELLNRLNNDVAKFDDGVLTVLPSAASLVTRLVAALIVLGMLDFRFALLICLVGLVAVAATAFVRRKLKELNKRVSEGDGKVSGFIQETLEKLLMVQAMDVAGEVERRSDLLLDSRFALQRKKKNVALLGNTCISIMSYGAGFFALCWCAWRMLHGQMSFGSLTAVIQLVNQLQMPFVNLSGVMPKYIAMLASAERLMELENIQGEPEPAEESAGEIYRGMDCISAENLSFSYDRERVFSDASFKLPKGSFAVITGPSGIGKSTLFKLMLGIFKADAGRLCFDGEGGERELGRSTRRVFAYVPQGKLLFSGSLRDNLCLAKPDASDEEIERAVYVSTMDEFLPQLPQGLETVLGENGAGLSEGQAQRLTIARAILGGAPVLLLDECTSALDEETEHKVLERIAALPGRTCIAVTHRPAALALADWHLELDRGSLKVYPIEE